MKIEIKTKKYNGHIILPEYLNIIQVRAFEESFGNLNEVQTEEGGRVWLSITDEKRLPVLFGIVKEWHIDGIPEQPTLETFPMTPISEAHDVIEQIYSAVMKLWMGEQVPND